jgi:hypothetical protein
MTGIEPALSAWESTDSVRIMHVEQQKAPSTSTREIPRVTGANGPPMARQATRRAAVTGRGGRTCPRVLQPHFATGHGDRELESGDAGDTCSRAVSPLHQYVFADHRPYGDTGDTFY